MPDIRVRVGQQNSIKVVSSLTGQSQIGLTSATTAHVADYAYVAGIATHLVGGGNIDVSSLNVTGISTFGNPIQYSVGNYNYPGGMAYFSNDGHLISGPNSNNPQHYGGTFLGAGVDGNPIWIDRIDGGSY